MLHNSQQLLCSTILTPLAIFYFPLPTPATPKDRFPSLISFSFAAFSVKLRRTSKPKVWKWDSFLSNVVIPLVYKTLHFRRFPKFPRSLTLTDPVSNVTGNNKIPLVFTYHLFNFKVRDIIRKNFHILRNDPETSSIFSNNWPPVSFDTAKNIRETLVQSSQYRSQDSSHWMARTFPCWVAKWKTCNFIDSATTISAPKSQYHVKHHLTCTSSHLSTASHAVDVTCFVLEKLEDLWASACSHWQRC